MTTVDAERSASGTEGSLAELRISLEQLHIFSDNDLTCLLPYLKGRDVNAGQTLWQEGQPGHYLALILSGHLEAKKDTEFPGKQVVVAVFGPGAVVGELSFLDKSPRAVSVVALEDAKLAVISHDDFDRLVTDHPVLGMKVYRTIMLALATRLKKSYERLAAIF
ncbi:MAG: Crp/Fnr family transcriptional regulator [Pedobacter sp.]